MFWGVRQKCHSRGGGDGLCRWTEFTAQTPHWECFRKFRTLWNVTAQFEEDSLSLESHMRLLFNHLNGFSAALCNEWGRLSRLILCLGGGGVLFSLTGVIALVIFVLVSLLAITGRVLYRRKETYRNREVIKQEDSQDLSFNTQPESQDGSGEHLPERDRVWKRLRATGAFHWT